MPPSSVGSQPSQQAYIFFFGGEAYIGLSSHYNIYDNDNDYYGYL